MNQNIQTLLEIPINSHSFLQSLVQDLQKNQKTKSQLNSCSESPSKISRKIANDRFLSPDILRSYELKPNILSHTSISKLHRAKMRFWISENCFSRKISAETASLACYILDFYFSKGNKCPLNDFHELGISCLRLANKLEENLLIPINYEVFSREKLLQLQASVCIGVSFCLNPITFTNIAQCLNYFWNQFKISVRDLGLNGPLSLLKICSPEYKAKIIDTEYAYVLLHQFLELVFYVEDSLQYPLDTVVANCFYLTFSVQFENFQNLLSSSKICSFLEKNQLTKQVWDAFIQYCGKIGNKLNLELSEKCLQFVYPIYNSLISEGASTRFLKEENFTIDLNDSRLRFREDRFCQTFHFKNKLNSFKKYMKKHEQKKGRKCSEMTHE